MASEEETQMSDVTEEIKRRRSLSEKIASYIPGYHGYKEKELRREADKLIRVRAAEELNQGRSTLKDIMGAVADSKRTDLYKTVNRVSAVFDRISAEVEHADYGYAGFFDAVKIKEKELDSLIEYDYGMITKSTEIRTLTEQTRDASQVPDFDKTLTLLRKLRAKLLDLETDYLNRKNVIIAVKK